jgi:hypothetical protein
MLDAANSQRKKKNTRRETVENRCCCCALSVRVLDGGFGILELAAGNYISAESMLLWLLPAFLPLGFWDAGFWNLGIMKLENTYPPVHAHVVVPVLIINLNGSSATKQIIRMIPVPSPVLKKIGFQFLLFASCSN